MAGILTQTDHTPVCFGIYASFGLVMFILSLFIDKAVENPEQEGEGEQNSDGAE